MRSLCFLAMLASLAACRTEQGGVVLLSVTATPELDVAMLSIAITAQGRTKQVSQPVDGGKIPPALEFAIEFPPGALGEVSITVAAAGLTSSGTVSLHAKDSATIALVLGANSDDLGTNDAVMKHCGVDNCATGCCDVNDTCVTSPIDTACGTNGMACTICGGSNHCIDGACGCATSADCPLNQACQATHVCTSDCTTATCNGGCCDTSTNQCSPGNASALCGISGACTSCAASSIGTGCLANGACGCSGPEDCPVGTACNLGIHQCTPSCAGGLVCSGTCCDGANCQPGTANGACGAATGSCSVCSGFDTCQNNACSAACTANGPCGTGGCCESSTCAAPTAATACGASCTDCEAAAFYGATVGAACVNGACGCKTFADCTKGYACNQTTHQCTTSCDGVTAICNTGCCSSGGLCVAGTSAAAAGYNGEKCTVCTAPCVKDPANNCAPNPIPVAGGATCSTGVLTQPPDIPCADHPSYCSPGGQPSPLGSNGIARSFFVTGYGGGYFECTCGCASNADCPSPSTKCIPGNLCLP